MKKILKMSLVAACQLGGLSPSIDNSLYNFGKKKKVPKNRAKYTKLNTKNFSKAKNKKNYKNKKGKRR